MDPNDKYMLIGAFATGLADAAIEGYGAYMWAAGKSPGGYFPYIVVPGAEWLPPLDDLLVWIGVPVALYAGGKLLKNPKLHAMAKGGAIYSVSSFVGETVVRASWKMQGRISLPAQQYVLRR